MVDAPSHHVCTAMGTFVVDIPMSSLSGPPLRPSVGPLDSISATDKDPAFQDTAVVRWRTW